MVHRLIVESVTSGPQSDVALERAAAACTDLFNYAATLGPEAHEAWSPYAHLHTSNAISFALQLILRGSNALLPLVTDFVNTLVQRTEQMRWDVFEAALRRSATLLLIASRDVPELVTMYRAVSRCLGLEVPGDEPLSLDMLLASFGEMGDLSWLDGALLGALGDASEVL